MQPIERLRRFVKERGTQADFAEEMNFARETVSRALSGSEPISPDFKVRFMDVYGFDAYRQVFDTNGCQEPTA